MSRASFRIAFDGEALADHTMNVRDLAPALMGLADAFVESNRLLHGEKTAVEVHVTPQIEENCFDIGIEVLQYWGAIKDLIKHSDLSAAKELVDWVLLNKEIAGGTVIGLVYLYRKIKGRRPNNIVKLTDNNGNPLRRLQFDDMPDIIVDEKVYQLYNSDKIRRFVGRMLQPIRQKEGIDTFTAYEKRHESSGIRISREEARGIDFSIPNVAEVDEDDAGDGPFEAVLRVYSPVYDVKASKWRFWYGDKHYYMDVTESNLADIVQKYGGVLVDDRFRVILKLEEDDGGDKQSYQVLEVIEFYPAYRQTEMLNETQERNKPKAGEEIGGD